MVTSEWYPNAVVYKPSIGEAMESMYNIKGCILYLGNRGTVGKISIMHSSIVYSKMEMNPYASAYFKYRMGGTIRW